MKKIYLLIVLAIYSIASYAQISFGGQIGGSLGLGKEAYDYVGAPSLSTDPKIGFTIGVLAEVEFGKLGFRPELNFIQKGEKAGAVIGFASATRKMTLNYVEVPLNVVYKLELSRAGKVFFGLGPAVGIGLSGKDKYSDEDINGVPFTKHDVKFDGKKASEISSSDIDTHLKRVDVGLNILAGFQLPMGVFAKIGYTHGFSNLDPDKDLSNYKGSYKNRCFTICLGYMLGGTGKKK